MKLQPNQKKRPMKHLRLPLVLGLAVMLALALVSTALAAVWTNQSIYVSGDTVNVSGDGMLSGETVTVDVQYPDGSLAQQHQVTADGSGNFSDTYVIPDNAPSGNFTVVATGKSSGNSFTTAFDPPPPKVDFQTSGLPSGVSITVNWSGTNNGGNPTSGSTIFTSPGPSSPTGGLATSSAFTYSGFPSSVTVSGQICTLTGTSPASGFLTGGLGTTTDVTATYSCAAATHSTSTAVTCTPNPDPVNASTTCTATVTDTSGSPTTPTGNVTFGTNKTGSFDSTTCALSGGSCSVSYTPGAGSEGTHTITASYAGDSTHSSSSGNTDLTVSTRTTSTTVSCASASIPVNGSITCTATVADTASGTAIVPTGTVTFGVTGSGSLSFSNTTCPLDGTGKCSVTNTPALGSEGTYNISASYGGDTDHATSSSSSPFALTVTKRSTSTAVNCTPNSVPVSAPTTCTATVTDSATGTAVTPTGTVTFTSDKSGTFSPANATCTLSSGSCSVTYTPAAGSEGTHKITASYAGDTDHSGSDNTGSSFSLSVTTRTTSTSVNCTPTSVPVNAPTTCTATVTDTDTGTAITPTGTVTFSTDKSGAFSPATTCTLNSGICSVTYTPAAGSEGTHNINASYGGDTDHSTSATTSAFSLTATKRKTSTAVSCSPAQVVLNGNTTCTATVTDSDTGTAITPTGTVTFTSDKAGTFSPANTCTLASGSCSVTYTVNTIGTTNITASYGGDTDHSSSATASPFPLTVIYGFAGFLQPINDTGHVTCGSTCPVSIFKAGSTIPVKFQLTDANGHIVQASTLPLWITPQQLGPMSASIDELAYTDQPTSGSTYRWDSTSQQYIYNWGTPKNGAGYYWKIGVKLDDGTTYMVIVGLR